MTLQALLVSKDDLAAETLTQVLANFGVAVHHSSAAEVAVARMEEEHFDQIIVDFDDPEAASQVLENNRRQAGPKQANPAVTVALLRESLADSSDSRRGRPFHSRLNPSSTSRRMLRCVPPPPC